MSLMTCLSGIGPAGSAGTPGTSSAKTSETPALVSTATSWPAARADSPVVSVTGRMDAMTQVQLIARHTIKEGHEREVLKLLDGFIDEARAEPGNLAFDAYRKFGDERSYVLLERYASRAALAAHRETPHFTRVLLGQIAPLLASRTIEEYDVPGEE
jgi:quinol monooxygenase YgiN